MTGKSNKLVLQTRGSKSVRENVVDVFGASTAENLRDLVRSDPSAEDLEAFSLPPERSVAEEDVSFEGLVSTCAHGRGRPASDRQFVNVNSRPCDLPRVARLVNDAYRQLNRHQYPFLYLDVRLPRSSVDVNVTPDKRTVMLQGEREAALMATLRASLRRVFQDVPATFECNRSVFDAFRGTPERSHPAADPQPEKEEAREEEPEDVGFTLKALKRAFSADTSGSPPVPPNKKERRTALKRNRTLDQFVTVPKDPRPPLEVVEREPRTSSALSPVPEGGGGGDSVAVKHVLDESNARSKRRKEVEVRISVDGLRRTSSQSRAEAEEGEHRKFLSKICPEQSKTAEEELSRHLSREDFLRMEVIGQFNLGFVLTRLARDVFIVDQHAADEKCNFERLERAGLLDSQAMVVPQRLALTPAEEDLLVENMDTFTACGFGFDVKEERGGGAEEEEGVEGSVRHLGRVSLTKVPHYRGWVFGKDDVDELLFMLASDAGAVGAGARRNHLRPSRVRQMLASRACRSSVMVGTALNRAQMRRLLARMADTEHPWNCPHGRPTMRHLVNLNLIAEK